MHHLAIHYRHLRTGWIGKIDCVVSAYDDIVRCAEAAHREVPGSTVGGDVLEPWRYRSKKRRVRHAELTEVEPAILADDNAATSRRGSPIGAPL